MRVGVLALQGAVSEHLGMASRAGAEAVPVKSAEALSAVDALILPGGESTTISRLIHLNGLADLIREFAGTRPVLGTCAGLILCAREADPDNRVQPLGLMDIRVERNGFGRQADSFETELDIEGIGPFPAVFIRAPFIREAGPKVRVLASLDGKIVMAEQGTVLVTAFHPELTDDPRVFTFFMQKIDGLR